MKKSTSMVTIIQFVLLIIMMAFIVSLICPWVYMFFGFKSLPDPAQPEIIHEEFPFKLIYELKGERITVEDVVICEYDGIAVGSNGKSLKWKKYLASNHDEDNVLLKVEGDKKIYYSVGDADYYMGDAEDYMYLKDYDYHQFSNVFYREPNSAGGVSSGLICTDELFDKYGIKLITWEPSPPITNTFVTGK